MFEKERFINDCLAALKEDDTHSAIRELVTAAVRMPSEIIRALGEPKRADVETLYRAKDLTILNLCWGPHMKFKPHDHRMWAVIGIYGGCEHNTFYRRATQGLEQHGTKELNARDTTPLLPPCTR